MPIRFRPAGIAVLPAMVCALPARADTTSDSIAAAQSACAAGDPKKAGQDLRSAQARLQAMQGESLAALAQSHRRLDADCLHGHGRRSCHSRRRQRGRSSHEGSGERFTIAIPADNPTVTGMGAMLSDESVIASVGHLARIASRNFEDQDARSWA